MKSNYSPDIREALAHCWNRENAENNLERWLSVSRHENWQCDSEIIPQLISVFGASWYFTRFIFFRGDQIIHFFEENEIPDLSMHTLEKRLDNVIRTDDIDENMDEIRLVKNEIMLQILICLLTERLTQAEIEISLTRLAESCLCKCIELFDKNVDHQVWNQIAVLAMGRMAGGEMNFGSDLDLIFIFPEESRGESAVMMQQSQKLLRKVSQLSPHGTLYEIDMRLRPHGSSGTLVTSANYFIEYHSTEREIWERQMMTRCRAVYDKDQLAQTALNSIENFIYGEYEQPYLQKEIITMREKVEQELGRPRDKLEIKRGRGGIMDIDFITHYLQLNFGHQDKKLRTASTRAALNNLKEADKIDTKTCEELTNAYDFLKMIEGRLRVYDMKSISSFSKYPGQIINLARSMGFIHEDEIKGAKEFLKKYKSTTEKVRHYFNQLVGEYQEN